MKYYKNIKRNLLLILCIIILTHISINSCSKNKINNKYGIINGTDVRVRSEALITSKVTAVLKINTKVRILEKKATNDKKYQNWYKIKTYNNVSGYVFSDLITILDKYQIVFSQNKIIRVEYINNKINIILNKENKLVNTLSLQKSITDIVCNYKNSLIFLAAHNHQEAGVMSIFAGIYDINKTKWITKFKPESLPNPTVHSFSPSKKYIAIDTGTDATIRGLTIVNVHTGKIVYNTSYISNENIWLANDTIKIYQEDHECKKNIPRPKVVIAQHHIKKLILWENGNERAIKSCIPGY